MASTISPFDLHKDEIIEKYKSGISQRKICEEYGICRNTLRKRLNTYNIPIRNIQEVNVSNSVNINFFDNIDTEEKAYILGFSYADGSICPNRKKKTSYIYSLSIKYDDKYLLEQILHIMDSTHNIQEIKATDSNYGTGVQCHVNITCKQIHNRLEKLGMSNKKHIPNIPEHLIHHFIRGVFDGDGCVSISNRGDIEMYIMGEESFLQEVNNYIDFNEPKFYNNIYKARKSGRLNAIKFYEYIYKDATIFLKRKKEIFNAVYGKDSQNSIDD